MNDIDYSLLERITLEELSAYPGLVVAVSLVNQEGIFEDGEDLEDLDRKVVAKRGAEFPYAVLCGPYGE